MEPPPNDKHNRMTYVIAFEEDGYVKDVTQRYAKDYWTKTAKTRFKERGEKEDWVMKLLRPLTRPYRLVCTTISNCYPVEAAIYFNRTETR